MKNIKKIALTCLLAVGSLFYVNSGTAQTISTHFFGENAWMPDTVGNFYACQEPPCYYSGKLHSQWNNIKASKTSIIRYGGIATDKNMPTNYQYIRMIDSIRANGMEPVLQVPFCNYRYTAAQAAAIVNYINVVKGKNVKYWIIANEPDLGYGFNSSTQIAAYFKPFASAMKAADPSILIIGPELSWFQKPVIDGLTAPGGPDDITGKDAAGRYYLDIISFHSYSFDGSQTRAQVVSKLTSSTGLQSSLTYLNARVAASNTAHNRTGASAIKTAITEANVGWQNPSTDNLYSVGANSFIGGQFVAEMLGISMKNSVDFVNLWSVIEGNSVATNCGFIDPGTYNKKPLFYHFQMLAKNFKGNYVDGTTNQLTVKSFGSKDGTQITVMILNEDAANNYNYTVKLNTSAIAGTSTLKININAGLTTEYTDVINNQSSTLLRFDAAGNILEKTEYSLSGHAIANLPPTVTVLSTTTGIIAAGEPAAVTLPYELKVFPNPTNGKFTIQLNRNNPEEKNFDIELFNVIGQSVYRKKSIFANAKEEIDLDPSIANGTYVLHVKQGDQTIIKKIIVAR